MLGGVQGYDSVNARLHCVAAGKAERVADVDDCRTHLWCDESEFLGSYITKILANINSVVLGVIVESLRGYEERACKGNLPGGRI